MTPNEPPAALLPVRWYVVTNYGAATLCLDEADARKVAHECDLAWPKNAPHVAVQLDPVASGSRGSVPDDLAGRVHDEIMRLDGGVRRWEHMGESQRAAWRNGLSILTPTPPAVASGEPTAEQWRSAIEACFCGSIDDAEWSRITALARSAAAKGEG